MDASRNREARRRSLERDNADSPFVDRNWDGRGADRGMRLVSHHRAHGCTSRIGRGAGIRGAGIRGAGIHGAGIHGAGIGSSGLGCTGSGLGRNAVALADARGAR